MRLADEMKRAWNALRTQFVTASAEVKTTVTVESRVITAAQHEAMKRDDDSYRDDNDPTG